MISNAEFWASNPMSMNDSSEIHYARGLLTQRMTALKFSAEVGPKLAADLSLDRSVPLQSFMICATAVEDSLNQWMHYYSGDGGYAVGVDTSQRLASAGTTGDFALSMGFLIPGWYSVLYDSAEQARLIDAVLSAIIAESASLGSAETWDFVRDWRAILGTVQLLLKDPAFAAEAEVRYLTVGDTSKSGAVKFRPGPRGIVPYLRLKAADSDRLPITTVYCGPGSAEDKQSSAEMVGVLLRANGYRTSLTRVERSRVPYRPSR